jgi:biotin transporter BioY
LLQATDRLSDAEPLSRRHLDVASGLLAILAIYAVGLVQLKLAVGRIWKQWKIVSNVYPFLPTG